MRLIGIALALLSSIPACLSQSACTLVASGGDDAPQFLHSASTCSTITIPKQTTLNIETKLNMTGLNNKHLDLQGTIRFNPDIPYWLANAFVFDFQNQSTFWIFGGTNLTIDGGGTLDGAGQAWYDAEAQNSTLQRPIILTIFQASNVVVQDIKMINGPNWFNFVNEATNVVFNRITINAVSTSANGPHNTDGWDIFRSDRVVIENSTINNGDDCVSFKPNATNVIVSNLNCNGSHGISVGSLGQYPGQFDIVENVTATNVVMANAQNGARIKAWAGPNVGSGIVRNITFKNFAVSKVDNPVVIDQCYMTNATACTQFPSNTFIDGVWFTNVTGTASGATVASLKCSPDGRCSNVNVNDLHLSPGSGSATYTCQNVKLAGNSASLFPADCRA